MEDLDQEKYDQLALYTLEHAKTDPSFIHQYIVDAFAAEHAREDSKNITVAFALIGLYLAIEKNYTGREVQLAHMQLAKFRKEWPKFLPPQEKGDVHVGDVLDTPPGPERDEMIMNWCRSVWSTWWKDHKTIAALTESELK